MFRHSFTLSAIILVCVVLACAIIPEFYVDGPCIPITAFMKDIITERGDDIYIPTCTLKDPIGADDRSINYSPEECLVSEWKESTTCNAVCDEYGTQTWERYILMKGELPCPSLTEIRQCKGPPCNAGCNS